MCTGFIISFVGLIKWIPPPRFSVKITDCHPDIWLLFPAQDKLDADFLTYWIEEIHRCATHGSPTHISVHERQMLIPLGQVVCIATENLIACTRVISFCDSFL